MSLTKEDLQAIAELTKGIIQVELEPINTRLDKIEDKIDTMQGQVHEMQGQVHDMQGQVHDMQGQMHVMQGAIDGMQGDISALKMDMTRHNHRTEPLVNHLTENWTDFSKRTRDLDGVMDKVEDHGNRISAIEFQLKIAE